METAVTGVKNIAGGVFGIVGLAGSAVKGTTEIAQKAVDASVKVTGAAVDAGGVLGKAAIDAASVIGKAGLDATSAIGESGLNAASALTTKTLDTAVDIGSAALDAANVSSTAVLETTGVTVKAATDVLQAGVTAGATLVTTSLNGFKELNQRIAARGALITAKWAEQQEAEGKAFTEIGARKVAGEEANKMFIPLADQLRRGVKQLIAVQQTTLAANINMYRLVKCTWWKRTFGNCEVDTIKMDTRAAKLAVNRLLQKMDAQKGATSVALLAGKDATPLIDAYMRAVDAASNEFEATFSALSDKYLKLTDAAISAPPPPTAGRRRKTARKMRKRGRKGTKSRRH